jgi:hypothetical protein
MMAGTIAVRHDRRWSAASWLFEWVVDFVAKQLGDDADADQLREVIEENLGWVDLSSFAPEVRARIGESIRHQLVPAAEAELPSSLPNRQQVVKHLEELAELVDA